MAKSCHACLDCRYSQKDNYDYCPQCGSVNRQYFMSKKEHKRGMELLDLQKAGIIKKLRFQPSFVLKVNGIRICKYIADADYYENGVYVVEDTKPQNYMTELAKFKIRLFESLYGMKVLIP